MKLPTHVKLLARSNRLDRNGGSAVSQHSLASGILNGSTRPMKVFANLLRGQGENAAMHVTVAGDLVTRRENLTHQSRLPLSNPAELKESRARPRFLKRLEDAMSVLGYAARKLRSHFRPRVIRESLHVEMDFDVNAQRVRKTRTFVACLAGGQRGVLDHRW